MTRERYFIKNDVENEAVRLVPDISLCLKNA